MAHRPLVIIHGWSDDSSSFEKLASLLAAELGRHVHMIDLADYESMDDDVTFDDVITQMDFAWTQHNLPRGKASVDVVVHSTGGLVIRDWLTRNFKPNASPIKHLVMLAPANFGSPLAHKGYSFLGRIVKGWTSAKMFQTGRHILDGLELASPYSWNLAMADRLMTRVDDCMFRKGQTLCTVLVGNKGYKGISAAANEPGSDGTVRVSTANLNCAHITADFSKNPLKPKYSLRLSKGRCAFGVMDGENHSSIAGKQDGFQNKGTLANIVRGLTVTDAQFAGWCNKLQAATDAVMEKRKSKSYTHGYQNTVFRVRDQFDSDVKDYFLEFYVEDDDTGWFSEMFHRDAIRTVHAYGNNASYRAVLVDCTVLHRKIDKKDESLKMSLTAVPEISQHGKVGYRTFADDDIGGIEITKENVAKMFKENRTVLVDVILKREQVRGEVFDFKQASG